MVCRGRLTGKVIILLVLLVQHCCRYIWNVTASITFAGDVYLEILYAKGTLKVLEEFDEVLSSLLLGLCGDFANRKACADGLLNPESTLAVTPTHQVRARHTIAYLLGSPMS